LSNIKWLKYPHRIIRKDIPNWFNEISNKNQRANVNTIDKIIPNKNVCVIPLCFVGKNLKTRYIRNMIVMPKIRESAVKLIIRYIPITRVRANEIYFLILLFVVSISGNNVAKILKNKIKINKIISFINPVLKIVPIKTITKIKLKIR